MGGCVRVVLLIETVDLREDFSVEPMSQQVIGSAPVSAVETHLLASEIPAKRSRKTTVGCQQLTMSWSGQASVFYALICLQATQLPLIV